MVHDDEPDEQEERDEDGARGRVRRMLAAGAVVIVIILAFLWLWRPWQSDSSSADAGRRPGRIATTEQYPASADDVTVWVKSGVRIEDVLKRHGLTSEGMTGLGSGLYVISAGERQVDALVEDLKRDNALYDAGRIYEQGSADATP